MSHHRRNTSDVRTLKSLAFSSSAAAAAVVDEALDDTPSIFRMAEAVARSVSEVLRRRDVFLLSFVVEDEAEPVDEAKLPGAGAVLGRSVAISPTTCRIEPEVMVSGAGRSVHRGQLRLH